MGAVADVSRVDELHAIEQIKSLSSRYALGLDRFNMETLMAPFAEDCVFDATAFELGVLRGRAEMLGFFEHNFGVMETQMHLFSNFAIELQGADAARGTNYLFEDGHTNEGARITCACLNEDEYKLGPDGWKITKRVVLPLLPPQQEGYMEGS